MQSDIETIGTCNTISETLVTWIIVCTYPGLVEDLCAEVVTPALLAPAYDGAVVSAGQRRALGGQTGQASRGAQLSLTGQLQQRQVIVHRVPGQRQASDIMFCFTYCPCTDLLYPGWVMALVTVYSRS